LAEESHLAPETKAYIGRSVTSEPCQVLKRDIRRFAHAIGDANPLWGDEEFAKNTPFGSPIAPPFFFKAVHGEGEPLEDLEPSGLGKKMGLRMEVPVPGFVGAVAGGHEVWFGVPIHAGDEITYENKIIDIYEKQGRSGPIIFIIDEWIYRNQRGEEVCRSRETLIRTK
jgi:acyl dehydratase